MQREFLDPDIIRVLTEKGAKSMNAALLFLRIVMGLGIAAHGSQKLFGWFGGGGIKGTGAFFENIGFSPGNAFAVLAGLSEFFGGLLFALGFLNPIGSALMVSVMLTAILTFHRGHGFFTTNNGSELPLLYLSGAVAVAFTGPGRFSVDHVLGLDLLLPQSVVWIVVGFAVLIAVGRVTAGALVDSHRRDEGEYKSERHSS